MKIQLAVIGAGSLLGRHLCRRAVRIGWDVHAFSMYDLETIYKTSKTIRERTFYPRSSFQKNWVEHITWNSEPNYDENFLHLKNEIRNVTGLVYIYEETPLLKSKKTTFEQNCVELSKYAGDWSVRHFVAVESENCYLNKQTEEQIGETTNPFMIISLLRTGKVYSYDYFNKNTLDVYKNRTLRSIGIDTNPINAINAETVAKCITTLIHNTNDPNIYRILEGADMEQYLTEEKIPFDSPQYDYKYKDDDNDDGNDDGNDEIDENDKNNQPDNKEQQNYNKQKQTGNRMSFGYQITNTNNHTQYTVDESKNIEPESVRDEQEKRMTKLV